MERYVLNTDKETMEKSFGVRSDSSSILEPTFNAAPGHSLPIIRKYQGDILLESAIWGIEENSLKISSMDINEVLSNESYRSRLHLNACIVPVSGFYKWKQSVDDPLPFFTRIHTREILGIAGFYVENEHKRNSFFVITKAANVLIKPLDETMPCILDPKEVINWVTGDAEEILRAGLIDLILLPEMTVFRVPDLVTELSLITPDLMQPIPKLREDD